MKNIGIGAAYNIKFKFDKSFKFPEVRTDIYNFQNTLGDIEFLNEGIDILTIGSKRKSLLFFAESPPKNNAIFNIVVYYKDLQGFRKEKDFIIDLSKPNYVNE